MKVFTSSLTTKTLRDFIILLSAVVSLNACSSNSTATNPADQSQLARETDQLEKLKSAEYQDYLKAMSFEDNNQKLGNLYVHKGAQVHHLIDELEKGQQVNDADMHQ